MMRMWRRNVTHRRRGWVRSWIRLWRISRDSWMNRRYLRWGRIWSSGSTKNEWRSSSRGWRLRRRRRISLRRMRRGVRRFRRLIRRSRCWSTRRSQQWTTSRSCRNTRVNLMKRRGNRIVWRSRKRKLRWNSSVRSRSRWRGSISRRCRRWLRRRRRVSRRRVTRRRRRRRSSKMSCRSGRILYKECSRRNKLIVSMKRNPWRRYNKWCSIHHSKRSSRSMRDLSRQSTPPTRSTVIGGLIMRKLKKIYYHSRGSPTSPHNSTSTPSSSPPSRVIWCSTP